MDAAAELGRNSVRKHQIQLEYGDEQADAGRDRRIHLSRSNPQARTETKKCEFPCPADHEQDWQPYPVDPYSCYMCDYTYNPLLLGTVNDTKYLAAMDFAPCMWLGPLFDSGNRFGAVISESTLASAAFDCSEFPHVNKIEYPPTVWSTRRTRMFGTTLTMPSSAVCRRTRMLLEA